MARKTTKRALSERLIRKNKAVNVKVVKEAARLSTELENMGVKVKGGYHLTHPLDSKRTIPLSRNSKRVIAQTS